ncbi:hypothetical protein TNCV_333691 [Trichonephila clavipes]|nr:hypothetical protein TNCV_333691 [Trichonephila clavipes]
MHVFKGVINYEPGHMNGETSFLQNQDGHIRVWRHRCERTLRACIRHRHTGPSPDVIKSCLNYFLLEFIALLTVYVSFLVWYDSWFYPLFKPCETAFHHDKVRPHVAGIV